jgi:hypothetical protein
MKLKIILFAVIAAACFLLVIHCWSPLAGNGSQVPNGTVSAMLYNPGGSPAAHATVRFCSHDYNPRPDSGSGTADSTITDINGNYFITLDTGVYTVTANGDSGLTFRDSIKAIGGDTVRPNPDTLKPAGTIRGVVKLEDGGDPRTVFILFMGTRTFTWPDDSSGNFSSDPMAGGKYRVRILTTLPDYEVMDTSFVVRAGRDSIILQAITLKYNGIPVIKGVKATLDSQRISVTVSWNRVNNTVVAGYNVYRCNVDSTLGTVPINKTLVKDTFFIDDDLIQRQGQTMMYKVKAVNGNGDLSRNFSDGMQVTIISNFFLMDSIMTNSTPVNIEVDRWGNIYAFLGTGEIDTYIHNSTDTIKFTLNHPNAYDWQFGRQIDDSGNIYLIVTDSLMKFDSSGNYVGTICHRTTSSINYFRIQSELVYLLLGGGRIITVRNIQGDSIAEWVLNFPANFGIAIDRFVLNDSLLVGLTDAREILLFNRATGSFIRALPHSLWARSIGYSGTGVSDMMIKNDTIFCFNPTQARVYGLSMSGEVEWCVEDNLQIQNAYGCCEFAVGLHGEIYFPMYYGNRIYIFNKK